MKKLSPYSVALPFAGSPLTGSPLQSFRAFYMGKCIVCGKEIIGNRYLNSTICSIACYNKHKAVKYKDNYCIECGKIIPYNPAKGTKRYSEKKYCSLLCSAKTKHNNVEKTCPTCGKTFVIMKSKSEKFIHCSIECKPITTKKCIVCGCEFKLKKSHSIKRQCCSKKCQNIFARTKTGNKNNNWKGGIHPENMIGRTTVKYNEWRISVFLRDERACKKCGSKKEIQAHHIKPWSQFKNLRYDINNGITLCKKCHSKVHQKNGNDYFLPDIGYNNQTKTGQT